MSSSVVFNHRLWDCNIFRKLNMITAKGREPIKISWMWTVKDKSIKLFFLHQKIVIGSNFLLILRN